MPDDGGRERNMARCKAIDIIDGYVGENEENGKRFISKDFSGSFAGKKSSRFAQLTSRATARFKSIISYTSVRCYSLFLLGFGLVSLILHFAKDYFGTSVGEPLTVVVVGAIAAILGILTVFIDKPLAIFLQDIPLTDYILFEFFCLKRVHRRAESSGVPAFVGLLLGVACAVAAGFLPFLPTVIAIGGVGYVYLAFLSPEFSLFSTFLIMPYLSLLDNHELVLSAFVVVNLLSFARKVVLGKRVFTVEQYDIWLAVFLLFVLISGIFVKGIESFTSSLVMILLSSGYALSGCIIANRRLADCLINALIFSSLPVSMLAIAQFAMQMSSSSLTDFSGVSATFSTPDVLAVFLLTAFLFSVYFTVARRRRSAKLAYALISVVTLSALVFTANVVAVAVAVVAMIISLALNKLHLRGSVLLAASLLPGALILLPSTLLSSLSELEIFRVLGLSGVLHRWQTLRNMLAGNLLTGIGIGDECFREELSKMGLDGSFTDGASFLGEIALEAGIFALLSLVFIIVIRIRHLRVYNPYTKNSNLATISRFTTAVLSALLVFGSVSYLFADMSMYFLFWCVMGVGSAALRVSRKEHDDRVSYYSDGRSSESSSIDVDVK